MKDERYPYWGVCDVEGCDRENCNGGGCWRETGYWHVCAVHAQAWRNGEPQPKMKDAAVAKEATRDPITGMLPAVMPFRRPRMASKKRTLRFRLCNSHTTGRDLYCMFRSGASNAYCGAEVGYLWLTGKAWVGYNQIAGVFVEAPRMAECRRLLEESIKQTIKEIAEGLE